MAANGRGAGDRESRLHHACILYRIGLVGAEYKLCRQLLSNNLEGNSSWRYSDNESKPRRERVHKDVVSVRFTPDMLAKISELASQSNMSRNMLIESVIADYVNKEYSESDVQE